MSHSVNHQTQEVAHDTQGAFLDRLKRNLLDELKTIRRKISLTLRIVFLTMYGCVKFIFEFEKVVMVKNIITPPLVTYILGKYCTLLPMYLVMPFTLGAYFIPGKVRTPILAVSVIASLFIVLAI
jgi:hypothetical protein